MKHCYIIDRPQNQTFKHIIYIDLSNIVRHSRIEKDHLNKFELGVDGRSLQTWPPINQDTFLAISFLKFV